jgi:hypothetical protein
MIIDTPNLYLRIHPYYYRLILGSVLRGSHMRVERRACVPDTFAVRLSAEREEESMLVGIGMRGWFAGVN